MFMNLKVTAKKLISKGVLKKLFKNLFKGDNICLNKCPPIISCLLFGGKNILETKVFCFFSSH